MSILVRPRSWAHPSLFAVGRNRRSLRRGGDPNGRPCHGCPSRHSSSSSAGHRRPGSDRRPRCYTGPCSSSAHTHGRRPLPPPLAPPRIEPEGAPSTWLWNDFASTNIFVLHSQPFVEARYDNIVTHDTMFAGDPNGEVVPRLGDRLEPQTLMRAW